MDPCRIYGFLGLIFLCLVRVDVVFGLICDDCDPTQCQKPVDCPGELILDQCRCCHVCGRVENETCGGPFDAFGRCGVDLVCFTSLQSPDTLVGVCKPKDFRPDVNRTAELSNILEEEKEVDPCADVRCQVVFAPKCPSDSKATGGNILPGECCPSAAKCVCNYMECLNPVCSPGYEKIVTKKGTGLPGSCCDIYECRTINDPCEDVECEETDPDLKCPQDSFKLPGIPSADGCCLVQQGCTCRPLEDCPAVSCPEGLKVQILEAASDKPGKCCDTYKCYNGTLKSCTYQGLALLDGDFIKVDKCTTCHCKNGVTLCQAETCQDIPMCSWMAIPEGQCCPVCLGCVASNGVAHKNGDQWNEGNDCVHCQCKDGEVYCRAEMCAVHCSNPRKIPGQCCPVCDEPEIVTVAPPHCPRMDNCTKMCAAGWARDMNGCLMCRCRTALCNLNCPYGYKLDQEGNHVCNCVEPPPGCMPLKRCTKTCIYGYKRGKNNCLKCRCNNCPFFSCSKNCTYGYEKNSEGCKICKCKEHKTTATPTTTTIISTTRRPPVAPHMCLTTEGRLFDDAESWYDGCRHCYCHSGTEMCSLITCPAVNCINPIIRVGDCCPSCPGDDLSGPAVVPKKCFSDKGEYKAEGETWALDQCTHCICHNNNVLCEMERCLPLPCKQPVKLPDMCCPICKENEISIESIPETNHSCSSPNGDSYQHGDTWRTNPCMSCTCRHGQIHCFSQTCPILSCNKTVLKKGQCCPYCFDPKEEAKTKCKYHDTVYNMGERWSPTVCKRCRCHKGRVKCHDKVCTKLENCAVSHTPKGECCPVCTDGNGGQIQMTIIAILVTIIAVLSLLVIGLFIVCIRRRNRHSVDIDSVPKSRSHDRNLNKNAKRGKRDDIPQRRRPPSSANVDLQGVLDSKQPDIISVKGMDSYKLCMDDSGRLDSRERGGLTTFTSDKEYVEDSKRKLPDKYKPNSDCSAAIHIKKSPQKSSDV